MHRISITSIGLVLALTACSSDSPPAQNGGTGGNNTAAGGTTGAAGTPATGGGIGAGAGSSNATAGTGGDATGGSPGTGGLPGTAGSVGAGGVTGGAGAAGAAGAGGSPLPATALVTSASGNFWKTGTWTEVTTGTADVTVNDATVAQTWDGFGGAFNEKGWSFLTTKALQDQAMQLLFGVDGAHFAWGRIPIGASDYAMSRYTEDDTGTDVPAMSSGSNRPPADTALTKFSITRDGDKLLPYIKAAQAVNPTLRFWASPWTPPVWMKTGYNKFYSNSGSGTATAPSYFDGGTMSTDAAMLTAYAQYFVKFVAAYKDKGVNIDVIAPANEPNYEQNYPSCLWASANYANFIATYLGPALKTASPSTKIMLGTMSNGDATGDPSVVSAVLANPTAKSFCSVAGAQWGMLDATKMAPVKAAGMPIWATEHKCGNYPWNPGGYPAYNATQAPNDMAYAVESWGYIKDAINNIGVTAYNAWNMVLDKGGLGIDTSRDWKQDALLVVDGGAITQTPAYYVFRHLAQYVVPGAKVVASGNANTVAFKNPDGSVVAVIYNSGAAKANFTVSIHGKMVQFAMPAAGWATVKL